MIVFLDIDGTCADSAWRFKKAGPEPKTRGPAYTRWLNKVQTPSQLLKDKAVLGMSELANVLHEQAYLVYLTGRSDIYRDTTAKWLELHGFPPSTLVMRPKRNRQGNGALKGTLIENHLKTIPFSSSDAIIVIDDDYNGEIEEVCKTNGWTFLKAKSGS